MGGFRSRHALLQVGKCFRWKRALGAAAAAGDYRSRRFFCCFCWLSQAVAVERSKTERGKILAVLVHCRFNSSTEFITLTITGKQFIDALNLISANRLHFELHHSSLCYYWSDLPLLMVTSVEIFQCNQHVQSVLFTCFTRINLYHLSVHINHG